MQPKHTRKYSFAKLIKKGFAAETANPISDPAILKAANRNTSSPSTDSLGRVKMKPIKGMTASSIFDIKKEEGGEG